MKIYTKTGDKGTTSLLGGTRVSKADAKIEAYGTVDELNSVLGVIAEFFPSGKAVFQKIQHKLFDIGSLLALEKEVTFEMPSVSEEDILFLEAEIDRFNAQLPELKNFILPGGSKAAGFAHLGRTVCRRAERRVVDLQDQSYEIEVKYLNRLSDFFFVLSREILRHEGKEEVKWQK